MLTAVTDLDLRLIRVFLSIVDAGGVSAAQSTLNVGQSTLSTQLSTLETRLGFALCTRGRGGFRLTPKGERFVQLARRLCEQLNDFNDEARNMDRQLVGALTLGLIGHLPMSLTARLGQAIARFRSRDEAVRLNVIVRPPGELEAQLLNNQVQVAVGYFWHRVPTLEYTPWCVERQLAYCGQSHVLMPQAGKVKDADLVGADWVWRSYPVPQTHPTVTDHRVTAVTDNMEAVALMILSGRHLGYLPEHVAAPYVAAGLMAPLNPKRLSYDVTLQMVARRPAYRDEITHAFMEDLRQTPEGRFTAPA